VFVHIPPIFPVLLTYSLKINSLLFWPTLYIDWMFLQRFKRQRTAIYWTRHIPAFDRSTHAVSWCLSRLCALMYFRLVLMIFIYSTNTFNYEAHWFECTCNLMASIFNFRKQQRNNITTITILHPFNGFFSRTTWVSRYQKGHGYHIVWVEKRGHFFAYL